MLGASENKKSVELYRVIEMVILDALWIEESGVVVFRNTDFGFILKSVFSGMAGVRWTLPLFSTSRH